MASLPSALMVPLDLGPNITVSGLVLRSEGPADLPFLQALFRESRAAQFQGIPGWGFEQVDALLAQQFAIQHQQFHQIPTCRFDIVEHDGAPIGRLYVDRRDRSLHIVDIALVPEMCGQGIGTALLSAVIAAAERDGLGVTLEVDHGNPALRLYQRHGFVAVADLGFQVQMVKQPIDSVAPGPAMLS